MKTNIFFDVCGVFLSVDLDLTWKAAISWE